MADMEVSSHSAEHKVKRRRKVKPLITFIIDSREQLAFDFTAPKRRELDDGGRLVVGLKEGDYAVALDGAQPLSIRVERKSEGDLFGVCGFGRERFEKELERLRQYEYRALVIECSAAQIFRGYERSQIPGKTVLASVLAWSVQYGLHVVFAGSRSMARAITQRLLEQYAIEFIRKTEYVPPVI
jgi:ERCC4-type nuclease